MSLNKKFLNKTASATVENTFNVVKFSGNGTAGRAFTVGFQPDYIVIKKTSGADNWRALDTNRGLGFINYWNLSNSQDGSASPVYLTVSSTGFATTSNGNDNFNASGSDYVAYCWKANEGTTSSNGDGSITSTVQTNTDAGFSIVKYTATGSTATVGHNLGAVPELIIGKTTNQSYDWLVYHTSLGNANAVSLQSSAASASNSFMNSTSPTSSVFTAGAGNNWNYASGNEIIAYCFHSVAGYSKISSYTGTGSALSITGLGFQPSFILLKCLDSSEQWYIFSSSSCR